MPTESQQHLGVEDVGGVTVAEIRTPRLVDLEDIKHFGEQLLALVDAQGARKLVLNFSKVKFFSSTALAKLFTLQKRMDELGGQLRLCCIPPDIQPIFKIVKTPFSIHKDEGSAVSSL